MKNSSKVDARPAFQWYPDDWLSEAGLRACDLSARGLWIDLLCFMFGMPERGKLKLNGRPLSQAELSRLVGRPEADVQANLKQLVNFGVAATDTDGTIYSRRMVRDESIRQAKIRAGRKGGQSKRQAEGGSPSPFPSSSPSSKDKDPPIPPPPLKQFFYEWNTNAEALGLPIIRGSLGEKRSKALKARWRDPQWRSDWLKAINKIRDCPFLLGESDGGWKATAGFFLQPDSVSKIMEGNYDEKAKGSSAKSRQSGRRFEAADSQRGKFDDVGVKVTNDPSATKNG